LDRLATTTSDQQYLFDVKSSTYRRDAIHAMSIFRLRQLPYVAFINAKIKGRIDMREDYRN
jgi:hypothetical protein